mmetsp:Transcript_34069/g.76699  ORF Transcript_34069/g.76699 Transcript_34069/m.76699 type:complete len:109 (-) Transcript_34069:255-581(-)
MMVGTTSQWIEVEPVPGDEAVEEVRLEVAGDVAGENSGKDNCSCLPLRAAESRITGTLQHKVLMIRDRLTEWRKVYKVWPEASTERVGKRVGELEGLTVLKDRDHEQA